MDFPIPFDVSVMDLPSSSVPRIALTANSFAFDGYAVLLSSCGGGGESTAVRLDTSNPLDVAEAFYNAVDDQDIDGAIEYVLPDMKSDFREAMSGDMPGMPSDYEVIVMAQGDEAEASVTGADLEVDMVLVDGRWWITR